MCRWCGSTECACLPGYRAQLVDRMMRGPCLWCGQPRTDDYHLPDGRVMWFCQCSTGGRAFPEVR